MRFCRFIVHRFRRGPLALARNMELVTTPEKSGRRALTRWNRCGRAAGGTMAAAVRCE
jgi:hypothetical protein